MNSSVAPDASHSGLGIASNLFGGAAALLLATSMGMLIKAAFSGGGDTAKGMISLVSLVGMSIAAVLLMIGFGLGVAGIRQPGRNPWFAITGTVINSSLLMTLTILSLVGAAAVKSGLGTKRAAAAAAAASAPAAAPAASTAPHAPFAAEIDRLAAAAAAAGYEKVLAADLSSDPARYESKKVAIAGYYSGTQLQSFTIYGKWASGGQVTVDGGQLSPETKKALLLSLDGFHMVFVRGVFKTHKQAIPKIVMFAPQASHRLFADEVVDLGKDANPK